MEPPASKFTRGAAGWMRPPTPAEADLAEAVRELAGAEKALNPRALGWALRPYLNRPMGGLRLVRAAEAGKVTTENAKALFKLP